MLLTIVKMLASACVASAADGDTDSSRAAAAGVAGVSFSERPPLTILRPPLLLLLLARVLHEPPASPSLLLLEWPTSCRRSTDAGVRAGGVAVGGVADLPTSTTTGDASLVGGMMACERGGVPLVMIGSPTDIMGLPRVVVVTVVVVSVATLADVVAGGGVQRSMTTTSPAATPGVDTSGRAGTVGGV